jgi:hypothetical membrane protein
MRPGMALRGDKLLLLAGAVAVGAYALGDLLSGFLYEGYSFRDQAISELTAIGSPVRPLMVAVMMVHGLLLVAFGVGVWRSGDRRSLRLVGPLLIAANMVGLVLHPVFPMHSRGMTTGFTDTMHGVLTAVFSLFVLVALLLATAGYRGWFRLYSIGTVLVLVGFGVLSALAIPNVDKNLPTPWMGAFERLNAYAYLGWLVVLAVILIRQSRTHAAPHSG